MWERALSISGLLVAGLLGALLATAIRFPIPRTISDWLTPIVAIATIGQAVFAYWALGGLQHARDQANSASKSLDVLKNTSAHQLRAYVLIDTFKLDKPLEVGKPIVATLTFKNTGQTPAMEMICFAAVAVEPSEARVFPPDLSIFDLDDASRSFLGAGQGASQTAFMKSPLSEADFQRLQQGTAKVVVFGTANYRDIFGENRITEFQVDLHIENPMKLAGFSRSPHGNRMT